jgi:RimJ/RimL family protein N-acetyltransferase
MNEYLAKNGEPFIIRQPEEKDAADIIAYSKLLFASTDQLLTVAEEYNITVESEIAWINNLNQNPNAKILIAETGGQIIGLLFFIPGAKRKNAHTGEFGVTIHPGFQGLGIGRELINTFLHWANNNEQIEKVFLTVFNTNNNAIALYKSLGFVEEGRHVKAVKQVSGEYADIIQMYIFTQPEKI